MNHMKKKNLGKIILITLILLMGSSVLPCFSANLTFVHASENSKKICGETIDIKDPSDQHYNVAFSVTFSPDKIQFDKTLEYDTIHLNDGSYLINAGEPMLPMKQFRYALPEGMKATDIQVVDIQQERLPGQYTVFPAQPPQQVGTILDEDTELVVDQNVYDSNEAYPSSFIELVGQTDFAGQAIAVVQVYPLQYYPKDQKLSLVTSLSFLIKGEDGYRYGDYLPYSLSTEEYKQYVSIAKEMVDNPDDVILHKDDSSHSTDNPLMRVEPGSYDYIVITQEDWVDDFQPLVNWKTKKGVPATVFTTDWIYNEYSCDFDWSCIQQFVQDAHSIWGTMYFLLGGDADIIPYETTLIKGDNIPHDTCYSDYDNDWVCEVHVGRAPVNTPEEISTFINKILLYEKNPPLTDYAKTAFFMGFDLHCPGSGEGENCKRDIKYLYMPEDWTYRREYDSEPGEHRDDVVSYINMGNNLINHIDHACTSAIGVGSWNHGTYLGTSEMDDFTNGDKQSIFYSVGCWTCDFPYPECIAEGFIRYQDSGGLAWIGNSRSGWHMAYNDAALSNCYDRLFYRSLFSHNHHHLGACFSDHKNDGIAYNYNDITMRYIFITLTLLGDPELPIWTDDPIAFDEVQYTDPIATGEQTFKVTVTTNGTSISNARVTLYKENEIYEHGLTDDNGKISFDINPTTPGVMNITVTKHNYLPWEETVTVSIDSDPDMDQYQNEETNVYYGINANIVFTQIFKPSFPTLNHVKLYIGKHGTVTENLICSIRDSLNGPDLAVVEKTPDQIPDNTSWITFDITDLNVNTGEKCFIVVTVADHMHYGAYHWGIAYYESLYPEGFPLKYQNNEWEIMANKDFCFETYGLNPHDELDRSQHSNGALGLATYSTNGSIGLGQSFTTSCSILTRIRLPIYRTEDTTSDLTVTIKDRLWGEDLVTITKRYDEIPTRGSDSWTTFDFQDIVIEPGEEYFIVIKSLSNNKKASYTWQAGGLVEEFVDDYAYRIPLDNPWHEIINNATFKFETYGITESLIADAHGPYEGTVGQPVVFQGSASYGTPPYSWLWDFGDGNTSDRQNPFHSYGMHGEYLAELTVTDAHNYQDNDTAVVTINPTPLIADAHGPYESLDAIPVHFQGNATGGVPHYSWLWNFGDGNTSTEQSPSHIYNRSGNFTVILEVTDSYQQINISTTYAEISEPDPLIITTDGPYIKLLGEPIEFHAFASGGYPPYTYHWDLGDGNTSDLQHPIHTYGQEGIYTVNVTVTDYLLQTANTTTNATICLPASEAWIDDDYDESTPGWGVDHFSKINEGLAVIQHHGIIHVYAGTYHESLIIDKSIQLIGENKETTIIHGDQAEIIIIMITAENVTMDGFTIQNVDESFVAVLISADNTLLKNNNIYHHYIGVFLNPSYQSYLQNVTISDNLVKMDPDTSKTGILLSDTSNSIIENNLIENTTKTGIGLQFSHYNILQNNTIRNHLNGIKCFVSSNNTIRKNILTHNDLGITTIYDEDEEPPENNIFYWNTFIYNTQHAYDEYNNHWYNQSLQQGNYWDDYDGEDLNGDGIGDTPYDIPGGDNQDLYPLMQP